MKRAAVTSGGSPGTHTAPSTLAESVPATADYIEMRHARRIRWHHVLVRRRRWSKELDWLCGRWSA